MVEDDAKVTLDERAKEIVNTIGVKAEARTINVPIAVGDNFKLASLIKFDVTVGDMPVLGFETNSKQRIGIRHFARTTGIDVPLGTTALENAKFLIHCIENNVKFQVTNVTERAPRKLSDGTEYVPKDYSIEVIE